MAMAMPDAEVAEVLGQPAWIEEWLQVKPGRDPLGLQTITQDRIMPQLVPGVLVLTQRARYLSYYAFLLAEFERRKLPATNNALSEFVKGREFEVAAALHLCSNGCGQRWSGVNGYWAVRAAIASDPDLIARRESVESFLGGYGLYYRTPLIDLGVVAPRGTQLGEEVTPVDVLHRSEWVQAFADAYRTAIAGTRYYSEHFVGTADIPADVLREYAEVGCLCRLDQFPEEQAVLRELLFSSKTDGEEARVQQRRRSFAVALRLIEDSPTDVTTDGGYRDAIISRAQGVMAEATSEGDTFARWAALVMKEYMQDAISCLWLDFCTTGLAEQPVDGLSAAELDHLLRERLLPRRILVIDEEHEVEFRPDLATAEFAAEVAEATKELSLEILREWAIRDGSVPAGFVLLFATLSRLPDVNTVADGWGLIGQQRSEHQPGLLLLHRLVADRMESGELLVDTFTWLARRYLIDAHQRIAWSKMPEFTFRFQEEDGRLRFYDNGVERFILANMHRVSITQIAQDVGYWRLEDGVMVLTPLGQAFLNEVFS